MRTDPELARRTRRTEGIRTRGRAERVVSAVLRATHEALGRVGYAALRIEEVAAHSGVNKTTIYRRWPTKAELVAASMRAAEEERELPDTGTLRGDLLAEVLDKIRSCQTPTGRGIVRMLQMERADPEVDAIVRQLRGTRRSRHTTLVERAVVRGELPADTNAELLLDMVFSPIYSRLIHRGEDVPEAYAKAVIDVVLAGAKTGAARLAEEDMPSRDERACRSS